jgi:hypothetical protein
VASRHPRLSEGWKDDLDQVIEHAIAVVGDRCEDAFREGFRIGLGFAGERREVVASGPEHIPDRPVAVVDAIEHGIRQTHEPPHQFERQIGTARRHPIDDHRPLQVEVLDEAPGLSPIDERSSIPYRDQPLGDLGGDALAAGLAGEFESQPTPDVRVVLAFAVLLTGFASCELCRTTFD